MTDVFLSYSHKDQTIADSLVRALEAEGLSVWWDHTIPPGQTWDSFIAKGIVDAKAVIVIWSRTSAASDWVKEEASIARKHSKYLPVQVDDADPPIGFSRIQAAQLRDWDGKRSAPQWQMLTGEVGKIMENSASMPTSAPSGSLRAASSRKPQRSARSNAAPKFLAGATAGVLIGAVIGFGVALYFSQIEINKLGSKMQRLENEHRAQLEERDYAAKLLADSLDAIRNPHDYITIDTLRVRIEEETKSLEKIIAEHDIPIEELDPELLKPTDWRSPVVSLLNARLERVSNELVKARIRYEGRLPAAPCVGPAC